MIGQGWSVFVVAMERRLVLESTSLPLLGIPGSSDIFGSSPLEASGGECESELVEAARNEFEAVHTLPVLLTRFWLVKLDRADGL